MRRSRLLEDFTARQLAHAFRSLADDDLRGSGVALSLLDDALTPYRCGWAAIDAAGAQFTRACRQYRACHQYGLAAMPPGRSRPRRWRWTVAWLVRTSTPPAPLSPDEAWAAVAAAGVVVAGALEPFGDHVFIRCQRSAEWGTCGLAILDDDGVCRSSLGHSDRDV